MKQGGVSFGFDDIEVKAMPPTKAHHNASRVGEEDECLLNVLLDVRRGGQLLLENALLRLLKRRSYAIVGANGVGKSTLLSVLSARKLNVACGDKMHLVSQFEDASMKNNAKSSALQYVLENDVKLNRVKEQLDSCDASQVEALVTEEELLEESATERARAALRKLGFRKRILREETPISMLSGGWRMRARLAIALNAGAQILLLDEPTTSLDTEGIDMLEEFMSSVYDEMCFVIVSHNRAFLERTCSDVLLFQQKSLQHYPMSFEQFWAVSAEKTTRKQHQFDKQEAKVQELKRQVQTLQSTAAKGHSNVAGAIGARKKKLEQIEAGTCNKHDNGKRYHRFSNKTFFYQYGPNCAGKLQPPVLPKPPRWALSPPATAQFGPDDVLIGLEDAEIGYDKEHVLLSLPSLAIRSGTKLLIRGRNGTGKSTLMRTIAGELPLVSGTRHVHHRTRVGYYSQLAGEKLGTLECSAREYLMQSCKLKEADARAKLSQFGIHNDVAMLRACDLSGGQRVRVMFAKLSAEEPHVILLDEPETHLDLLTIAQLSECLSNWNEGAIVMITHDDYLAELCNQTITTGEEE